MGVVMINCPKTGCKISTGMEADRSAFNHAAVFFARAYCPVCKTQHEWFAKDAWVDEPKRRADFRIGARRLLCSQLTAR
jgi:hypothetical protein